jgi:predicted Fe-S protein YdhL (DUF1289 family)
MPVLTPHLGQAKWSTADEREKQTVVRPAAQRRARRALATAGASFERAGGFAR